MRIAAPALATFLIVPSVIACVPAPAVRLPRMITRATRWIALVAAVAVAADGARSWAGLHGSWTNLPVGALALVVGLWLFASLPFGRRRAACPPSILLALAALAVALVVQIVDPKPRELRLLTLLAPAGAIAAGSVAHRRFARVPELGAARLLARVALVSGLVLGATVHWATWTDAVAVPLLALSFLATVGALAVVALTAARDRRSPTDARLWQTAAALSFVLALLLILGPVGRELSNAGVALAASVGIPAVLIGFGRADARGLAFDPDQAPELPPGASRVDPPREDFDPF